MKVISAKYLPARPPLLMSFVWWLMLDRLKASDWVWGVVGTLGAIVWIVGIYGMCTQKYYAPEFKEEA